MNRRAFLRNARAARKSGVKLLPVINQTGQPAALHTPLRHANKQWLLSGPAIHSTTDVTLAKSHASSIHADALNLGDGR